MQQSLSACEPDIRNNLFPNVVLCGGGSLFAGLADRLNSELIRHFAHVSAVYQIYLVAPCVLNWSNL